MPLTRKQKKAFRTCIFLICFSVLLSGVIVLIIWASSAASVQKYCSGSTLVTITTDHGGSNSVAVKEHGC
jgi:ABC-type lipoprotein release transport system permease subunit